ncbi:hypothetical protein DV738_g836, partial [Chaetothyriales sp. CBS 135597]
METPSISLLMNFALAVTFRYEAIHARHRRLLVYAFSDKALKDQEPIIQGYVDLFVEKLRQASNKGAVNIRDFVNFVIFDITGDLMFGESFGCLEESKLHPWIELLFGSAKAYSFLIAVKQFPLLSKILESMIPKAVIQKGVDHFNLTAAKTDERLKRKTDRPDIITFALRNGLVEGKPDHGTKAEKMMTRAELHSNAYVMIGAGSEEPATQLAGCLYYLATHEHVRRRLRKEIIGAFHSSTDITIAKTAELPYLSAVINESFRIYSPFVTSLPRIVQGDGDVFAGQYVPGGTIVSCHLYASFHSPANFALPEEFIPDRWLGTDERFAGDKRDVLHPASLGPRGCVGKALGYAEIRLVLCKLLWTFDMTLCEDSRDWLNQDVFIIWDKPPLMVRLTETQLQ